ncbi:MAG TPA: caspase family protein [Rhizomicrobium sp.]|jgi:hypothetical protein
MTRSALIIGNPGETGASDYCPGVDWDLVHYKKFLLSPVGGAWYDSEITTLNRPNVATVRAAITTTMKYASYSFVVFCGHGCTRGNSTILELRKGEEINELELRRGSPRHTLVLDCCRELSKSVLAEDTMMRALLAKADMEPRDTRKYFDEEIARCPTGLVVQHACALGETAQDDPKSGGYYSSNLIRAADDWASARHSHYSASLLGVDAHTAAANKVVALSGGRQNPPPPEKPRSGPYFPFGVVAF